MVTRLIIVTVTVITLILTGLFKAFVLPVQAETLSGAKWYLRDEDVDFKAIGNGDNDGKSIFFLASDDCKIVYVNGIPAGATIVSASLKINSSDSSDISGAVSYVLGSWSEATTWSDAPAVGAWIADLSNPAAVDAWSVANVHLAVGENGAYNFYLTSVSSNNACYKSREAPSSQPVLVIEYAAP